MEKICKRIVSILISIPCLSFIVIGPSIRQLHINSKEAEKKIIKLQNSQNVIKGKRIVLLLENDG